jgi:hypothetical protein
MSSPYDPEVSEPEEELFTNEDQPVRVRLPPVERKSISPRRGVSPVRQVSSLREVSPIRRIVREPTSPIRRIIREPTSPIRRIVREPTSPTQRIRESISPARRIVRESTSPTQRIRESTSPTQRPKYIAREVSPPRQMSIAIPHKRSTSETKTGLTFDTNLPPEILDKILENLSAPDRANLAAVSGFFDYYLTSFPQNLYDFPIDINDFTNYFGQRKKANLTQLTVKCNIIDNNLKPLEPFLANLERLKIDFELQTNGPRLDIDLLTQCKKLHTLEISNSRFTFRVDLAPLASCPELKHLTLIGADCYRSISLAGCTNLESLTLEVCSPLDIILDSIKKLTKLKRIILKGAFFITMPFSGDAPNLGIPSLVECKSLEEFSCTSAVIPDIRGLSGCTQLKKLVLEYQTDVMPDLRPLSTCTNLEYLELSLSLSEEEKEDSDIQYFDFDTDLLEPLSELQTLKLNRPQFNQEANFRSCYSLQNLYLSNVGPGLQIPPLPGINTRTGDSIKVLSLIGVDVTNLSVLDNSSEIEELFVERCRDTENVDLIINYKNLKKLTISHSDNMGDLLFIGEHIHLTELTLIQQRITNLYFLMNCPNLIKLILKNNANLESIHDITNCPGLEIVTINFSVILDTMDGLETLSKLKELELSKNLSLTSGQINNSLSSSLTKLRIETCPKLDLDFIDECKNITSLELVSLNIDNIDVIGIMTKLNTLSLNYCPNVTSLTPLKTCISLRTFSCQGNRDFGLKLMPLVNCPLLSRLDLGDGTNVPGLEGFMYNSPDLLRTIIAPDNRIYRLIGDIWLTRERYGRGIPLQRRRSIPRRERRFPLREEARRLSPSRSPSRSRSPTREEEDVSPSREEVSYRVRRTTSPSLSPERRDISSMMENIRNLEEEED